jgi:hypothetical protein
VRLLVLDAKVTDASRVLALLEAHDADRRLVLGGAAEALATYAMARRQTQDDAFLDAVAAYVLEARDGDPPERPAPPQALSDLLAVHDDAEALTPLSVTDRAVEIAGSIIGMAVPDRGRLLKSEEDLGNATFWVAGGQTTPSMDKERGVPIISPGHLGPDGGAALLVIERRALDVTLLNDEGETVGKERFAFEDGARLSVRSG